LVDEQRNIRLFVVGGNDNGQAEHHNPLGSHPLRKTRGTLHTSELAAPLRYPNSKFARTTWAHVPPARRPSPALRFGGVFCTVAALCASRNANRVRLHPRGLGGPPGIRVVRQK